MQAETKICQNCKASFTIEPDDFGFYEKIKVPPPTFCPECRRQRRWAWRNCMSLYNRKCDLCEKPVISVYHPDSGLTIYCNKCWWSDKWDPKSYAQDYDFSRPFFEQHRELVQRVPHMAVVNDDNIASLNCEYTHDWWFSKNCYMCFSGWHAENIMYSYFILAGKYIVDCMNIRSTSEWLYECMITSHSYNMLYTDFCGECLDCAFIYDCANCQNCFMSTGLRNKKYIYKNKKYSKEEYEKILKSYQLETFSGFERAKKEFREFMKSYPKRYAKILRSKDSTGNIISYSKNCRECFVVKNSEHVQYSDFVGDNTTTTKDSHDLTTTGGVQESYECVVGDHSQLNRFALFTVKSQDTQYCQHCHNCKHSIGCVGLRNSKYCILNKEYSKEEYEKLMPKIIKHMNEMPYKDKQGIEYRYGEFYPIELSPFGYNETYAPELVPLSKEEAGKRGYQWQDNLQKTTGKETLSPDNIPDSIDDVNEKILDEVLKCALCERNYKIVKNEFLFYKKMRIPIPRKCFLCRYQDRLLRRDPFQLWPRKCMCGSSGAPGITAVHDHKGECPNRMLSVYSPKRPDVIYCEKCYQKEVY